MIVGNKVDIVNERQVPPERPIKEYKNKLDIDCREVSAKTGYKIEEVFQEMLESTSDHIHRNIRTASGCLGDKNAKRTTS